MRYRRKYEPNQAALTDRINIRVRFSEVDSMQIVWHGAYIKYFEDGREAFGKRYGISYSDIYNQGYKAPIVDLTSQYRAPLRVGDDAIVETRYIATNAAKLVFEYTIFYKDGITVVATGSSMQVFLNMENELELVNPGFFIEWKKKWGIS